MQHISKQMHITSERGFTLVEMLVSLSLFAMVMTMSVSMLLVLIDANGRAQSMQLVMTNVSFALDSMTREIRTGTNWYCGTNNGSGPTIPTADSTNANATADCSGGGNYISITESGSSLTSGYGTNRITYWFDDDYYGTSGALLRKVGGPTGSVSDWIPLTGQDIDIEEFKIVVAGTDRSSSNNWVQPTMTMYIKGLAGFGNGIQEKEFSLQTSVTQRTLDI